MLPTFRYDLKGRMITAGIVGVMITVTTLMMPYLQATLRNNRVFLLGVTCLAVMSLIMLRRTLTGALLLGYVAVSLYVATNESMGSAMYQILCFGGLFILAVEAYDHWRDYKGWVYDAVCLIAIANVASQIIQMFGVAFPKGLIPGAQYGYVGLMANVNETSALLAVCLPFFFRKRWRVAIPVIVAGLFMARTTNGILAAGVVSALWLLLTCKKWALVTVCYLVIIALAGTFVLTVDRMDIEKQMSGRGLVYKRTAQTILANPLGWGFGQYDYVIPLLTYTGEIKKNGGEDGNVFINYMVNNVADKAALDRTVEKISGQADPAKIRSFLHDPSNNTPAMFVQAHNEYLELGFACGIPGLILALLFLWRSLVRGFRKRDKLPAYALTASALTAVFFFVWQIIPIAILTVLCLVLIWSKEGYTA